MITGIILGLLAQLSFAVGLAFINQADFGVNQYFIKSNLVLLFSGFISLLILVFLYATAGGNLSFVNWKNCKWLLIGSFLLLVVGEYFFIKGASVSGITTVAFTALAFPIIALLIDYATSRFIGNETPLVGLKHIIGFVFVVVGFIIYTTE